MKRTEILFTLQPIPYQPGWPQLLESLIWDAVSFVDIDGESMVEVLGASVTHGYVHLKNHDGTNFAHWPVYFGEYNYGAPVAGDVDNDSYMEIFLGANTHDHRAVLYGWKYNGTNMIGWPKYFAGGSEVNSSAALSDIDNDGDLEIIFSLFRGDSTYIFNHDGSIVNGWPAITEMDQWCQSSAAIGDIDNDGDMEVIIGSDNHKVYAFHHDASLVEGWPISGPTDQVSAPISMGDIDHDGDIEIGVGSLDNKIHF